MERARALSGVRPTVDLNRGRKVGRYEVLTRLSVGGMAELFLAFTEGPGGFKKFVALKQILPAVARDDAFVRMFLDEARITAGLNHAHIAQVFDLGEVEGRLFLAMEFVAGQNAEQVQARSAERGQPALPWTLAARIVRDVALGLESAHTHVDSRGVNSPVIHRDVSPKNIMVSYSGEVKLVDFGIAKARARLHETRVGVVKGTNGYMAPEQVRGESVDARADIFSVGAVAYEMLAGERLFVGATDEEVMRDIATREVPELSARNPQVPPALSDAVMRCLRKSRSARFATAGDLARAIEAAVPALATQSQVQAFMDALFADKRLATLTVMQTAGGGGTDEVAARAAATLRGVTDAPGPSSEFWPNIALAAGAATALLGFGTWLSSR